MVFPGSKGRRKSNVPNPRSRGAVRTGQGRRRDAAVARPMECVRDAGQVANVMR